MKRCSHCGEMKPLDEFHSNVSHRDGLSYWCKTCIRISRRGRHTTGGKRERDPVKDRARERVRDAVRYGKLIKPTECSRCHQPTPRHLLDAHHHAGYDKPLEVEWLCRQCHEGDHHGFGTAGAAPGPQQILTAGAA